MINNQIKIYSLWKSRLLIPIIIFLLYFVYTLLSNGSFNFTRDHLYLLLSALFFLYLFMQFEITTLVIDFSSSELKILYPLRPFFRLKKHSLKDIQKVKFNFSPAPYVAPIIMIYLRNGKNIYYCIPDFIGDLAERLKNEGIEVESNRSS